MIKESHPSAFKLILMIQPILIERPFCSCNPDLHYLHSFPSISAPPTPTWNYLVWLLSFMRSVRSRPFPPQSPEVRLLCKRGDVLLLSYGVQNPPQPPPPTSTTTIATSTTTTTTMQLMFTLRLIEIVDRLPSSLFAVGPVG